MEIEDHAYTCTTFSPLEFTYKMSSKEIEDFVKLRVSNNWLFTGRRNTSMWAWRAILKHMGLQHKMTHSQASKKWENMKKRYKELKNPPDGVKVFPHGWPHFSLMEAALEGRLAGGAPTLEAPPNDRRHFLPASRLKKRRVSRTTGPPVAPLTGRPETEVPLSGGEDAEEDEEDEVERERSVMERERRALERERLVLQRERAVLDREAAALLRDRALLERERAAVERDRDAVNRDRVALQRQKAGPGGLSAPKGGAEELAEGRSTAQDPGVMDRKERFLILFEKLIEKF